MAMRRALSALAAATLAAGVVSLPRVAVALPCANETIQVHTLHVEMKPAKKIYRIGEVAKFNVRVTRPSDEDPVGQGMSTPRPIEEPAADVSVGIGLAIGDVFLYGFSVTDEQGESVLKILIERYVPRNETAFAVAVAQKRQVESVCANVDEYKLLRVPNAFKTR